LACQSASTDETGACAQRAIRAFGVVSLAKEAKASEAKISDQEYSTKIQMNAGLAIRLLGNGCS